MFVHINFLVEQGAFNQDLMTKFDWTDPKLCSLVELVMGKIPHQSAISLLDWLSHSTALLLFHFYNFFRGLNFNYFLWG